MSIYMSLYNVPWLFYLCKGYKETITVDASLLGHFGPCIFWPHKAAMVVQRSAYILYENGQL